MSESDVLLPVIDEDGAGFWEGTAAGELRMQACGRCGHLRFPPRPMCPHCQSTARRWQAMSGRGQVWSFVVPHAPVLPVFAPFTPFAVITVELEEDPTLRLVGNLLAAPDAPLDSVDPATVTIGEPVCAVFVPVAGGIHLPQWVRGSR